MSCNKIHLVSWQQVSRPKEQGGLGILDLRTMNQALMTKWWWLLLDQPNGTLQSLLLNKYGPRRGSAVYRPSGRI